MFAHTSVAANRGDTPPARRVLPLLVALLLFTGTATAQEAPASSDAVPPWTVLDQRPGEGEQCLVCGERVFDEDVVEIRYQGRVFHVGAPFLRDFMDDPDRYFTKIQARSALFDEASMAGRSISFGWLIFGGYVLVGLVFGALCGYLAVGKALAPLPWFFAGLAGNVAALIVLLFTPAGDAASFIGGIPAGLRKVPVTREPVACAACGATNHPSARKCAGCGAGLEPAVEAEARLV